MNAVVALSTELAGTTFAASGSDDGGSGFFALILAVIPFVAGWFFYSVQYKRYRNQDERYQFEHTTKYERHNLKLWDDFAQNRRRLRNRYISNRNDTSPGQRARQATVTEVEVPPKQADANAQAPTPDGGSPNEPQA